MSYIGNKPFTKAEKKTQQHAVSASKTIYQVSGGYTEGLIDVFLNGVLLLDGIDYTATNGTSITLINATIAGDTLVTIAWGSFSAANVPSDITESGSNVNGNYIKFDDGTMICWFTSPTNYTTPTAAGNIYISGDVALTFPVAFISAPIVTISLANSANAAWADNATGPSTTGISIRVMGAFSSSAGMPSYIAMGKWK